MSDREIQQDPCKAEDEKSGREQKEAASGVESQHEQGGYASPAQGSRGGRPDGERDGSGYGSASGEGGVGHTGQRPGREPQDQGGGSESQPQSPAGGTYGQDDYGRPAQRSAYRRTSPDEAQREGVGARDGGSGHADDPEPH